MMEVCSNMDTSWTHMKTTVAVQWDIYVQCDMHNFSGAYVSNVECMYTNVPGHIVDYS